MYVHMDGYGCKRIYGNVPLISDNTHMIKCILCVLRASLIDFIYYVPMHMVEELLDESFHVLRVSS